MENHHPFRVCAHAARHFKRASRRRIPVDLGVTFIREYLEVMGLGERDKGLPIFRRGYRTLRVRGRADVGNRGPVQNVGINRLEIGQIPGLGSGGQVDRLGANGKRCDRVDLIEGVRRQHDRLLAILAFGAERHASVIKPFARAVQRQNLGRGVDVDTVALPDPISLRRTQRKRAVILGVFGEALKVVIQNARDPLGKRVTRLADGHENRVAARLHAVQQRPQTRKRIFWEVRKPLRKHHYCLINRSH
mmetsp:Transcript_3741/g.6934  ORF Transcript_3741/g.6934 Transcript_3741/m.6934 type:complete len:248 (+) Transcript_3741:1484-2227(+)